MPFINTAIMKNPLNWITVLVMVLFAGFVVRLVLQWENSASK